MPFPILLAISYIGYVVLREYWYHTKNIGYEITRPQTTVSVLRALAFALYAFFWMNSFILTILVLAAAGVDIWITAKEAGL